MTEKIVYLFPSCASKVMSFNDHSMTSKIIKILQKLSYQVEVINLNNDCCGLMYSSMGYDKTANKKRNHLLAHFSNVINQNHSAVILIENSSCIFEIYSKESENNITKRITFVGIYICDIMQLGVKAVESLLSRARENLKKELDQYYNS